MAQTPAPATQHPTTAFARAASPPTPAARPTRRPHTPATPTRGGHARHRPAASRRRAGARRAKQAGHAPWALRPAHAAMRAGPVAPHTGLRATRPATQAADQTTTQRRPAY